MGEEIYRIIVLKKGEGKRKKSNFHSNVKKTYDWPLKICPWSTMAKGNWVNNKG